MKNQCGNLALGIDVGGTKILASVIDAKGNILSRQKTPTPRGASAAQTIDTIADCVKGALQEAGLERAAVKGAGVAVPGIVSPDEGKVMVTPNTNLSSVNLGSELQKKIKLPVIIGNDANLGTLGVHWRELDSPHASLIGIFVGTGIGAGIIVNGNLLRGGRETAGEIGHMIVAPQGPLCGCGNRGCLETLAGRAGIERRIREEVKNGAKTILTKMLDGDLKVIKSGKLHKALKAKDKLVTKIIKDAARHIGYACLSLQHILDPDMLVLGGGLVEACGEFMLPVIKDTLASDRLCRNRPEKRVMITKLGDDAVIYGCAALVFSQK